MPKAHPTGHDWELDSVDGPSALEVGPIDPLTSIAFCTFDVWLSLSGFMDKWDWFGEEHPDLHLWDGDWNDYVVSVTASPEIRMCATVLVCDAEQTVEFLQLTEQASTSGPSPESRKAV
ncbi:hypothetical protein [Tessaracoccus sp. MC1756]|uniref:hypothetical protein n=1 Tax=Tessaracoccus sp. MC1756 TaxID=2760311 RepID=UPI001603B63E|nr:hypothetical protein [Tessaracoccus sp. MC1756]MBB1510636.1 hypothetical protein [Tessaracoccus sp. MC1756]